MLMQNPRSAWQSGANSGTCLGEATLFSVVLGVGIFAESISRILSLQIIL